MAGTLSSAKQVAPRLCLLGAFRFEIETRPIHFPTRKDESLLAYLALFPEPHPREKLAALLWGDSTDEQARHSLRSALTTLRTKLGDDVLLADRETVQLNPDYPLWVDALEFQQSLISDPQSAIELYHGELLPDFYDDWILVERERLRQLYLDTLLRLAQEMRSQSQYARAIELVRKVLATEPTNEAAHQHLMFCLAATGDRIGALKQYDECQRLLRDELGVEPSSETVALREQIECELTGAPSRTALLTNVPTPLTSFVGRQREVAEIKRLLDPSGLGDPKGLATRLLTLTGAGGCGKTRLAIQVATGLAGRDDSASRLYKHGVWWVDLSALSAPELVPQTVAKVFDLRESADASLITVLTNYLRSKELLLVLDNCEHLIEACAQLAEALLSACPHLQILATSREALGLTGEVAWYVPSLESPDPQNMPPLASLPKYDAIRLLAERAQAVAPHWQLADHAEAAARICCRLDGIPLAIELAAARLKVLAAEQVAERLDDRFQLLMGGSRTALPRHQTLRATMDWSYHLLYELEQVLLRRLSVFAGGWTLEGAEAVCSEPVKGLHSASCLLHPAAVLDLLTRLVDKSLVIVEERGGATRYRMLETIRQYAQEKLDESNERDYVRANHRDFFLRLAEDAVPKLHSAEQVEWFNCLEIEHENMRTALEWSRDQASLDNGDTLTRLAAALAWFWRPRGYWRELREWLEQALQYDTNSEARALALFHSGLMNQIVAKRGQAQPLYEESLALSRKLNYNWGIALAAIQVAQCPETPTQDLVDESISCAQKSGDVWLQAFIYNQGGLAMFCKHMRPDSARSFFEQSAALARQAGDRMATGSALSNLGEVARAQGDYESALALYEESLACYRQSGNKRGIPTAMHNLGYCALHQHDHLRASVFFAESLKLCQDIGENRGVSFALAGLGGAAAMRRQSERAARLLAVAQALLEAQNRTMDRADRPEFDRNVAAVRAQLDEATFNAAWEEGRKMTLEQAIEYALSA